MLSKHFGERRYCCLLTAWVASSNNTGTGSMAEKGKVKKGGQGAIVVWLGMTVSQLWRLFRMGPPIHVRRALALVILPCMAIYNSLMGAVEKVIYSRRVSKTQPQHSPIFIIGHWRSGTTLLHDLISQDPQFSFANMYQVLFPGHFLTTEKVATTLSGWLPMSRPMDNVPLSWKSPQEDEIALLLQTLLSGYLVMAFPDDSSKYEKMWDFKGLPEEEVQCWKETFQHFVKKLTVRDPRQLVMKSPTHTMKIPLLLEMYPDAKFIYIHREPYNVIRSGVHLRRRICEANMLGNSDVPNAFDDVLDLYEHCFHTYHTDKGLIPEGRLHEVRFEDLEQEPLDVLEEIYEGLSLQGFETLRETLLPQIPRLKSYKKNKFDRDQDELQTVYERLRFAYEAYGYPCPAELQEPVRRTG